MKDHLIQLQNQTHPLETPLRVTLCHTFFCRLKGLMFRRHLLPDQGLLLVEQNEGRYSAAIHMLFMRFDLTVVWLDAGLKVVELRYARRWHPVYLPKNQAQYVLETHVSAQSLFEIGDQIVLIDG